MKHKQQAFSLIELMIAVVIVGVLTAIGYPSYQQHINSSKEAEARAALMSLATEMSQFHMDRNTYNGAFLGEGGIFPNQVPISGGKKTYDLAINSQTATEFEIAANPVDSGLTTYTLDETGEKTPEGW